MEITNVLIGCICALGALLLSAIAALRNKKKDDEAEGSKDGALLTEIGYIKRMLDEIKDELQEQRKSLNVQAIIDYNVMVGNIVDPFAEVT